MLLFLPFLFLFCIESALHKNQCANNAQGEIWTVYRLRWCVVTGHETWPISCRLRSGVTSKEQGRITPARTGGVSTRWPCHNRVGLCRRSYPSCYIARRLEWREASGTRPEHAQVIKVTANKVMDLRDEDGRKGIRGVHIVRDSPTD